MFLIFGGFALALIYCAVALLFAATMDPAQYYDISLVCGVLRETPEACREGAVAAGIESIIGLTVAAVWAFLYLRRDTSVSARNDALAVAIQPYAGLAVLLLVGLHFAWQLTHPAYLNRIEEVSARSTIISLSNLAWPMLLLLLNWSRQWRGRFYFGALLLVTASLSPFRAVLLAIFFFAVALPLLEHIWSVVRQRGLRNGTVGIGVAAVIVAALAVGYLLFAQTAARESRLIQGESVAENVSRKTIQRVANPLFHAHMAQQLSVVQELPDGTQELLKKLRLSSRDNLNEHLYARIYGAGTVGETTSLYFGEAAANSRIAPVVWIAIVPMLLVGLARLFAAGKWDISTLVGLAIWRGSMGGIFTVLPALAIQLLLLAAICWWVSRKGIDSNAWQNAHG